ncbi:hypothetical protein EJB05_56214 [Eragrostis curvula]|uniref:Uncharacterized protein n=1 Tax=Eragrostis curvula TaxID=38414 RepID=A0A5J9SGS1_9POAL|nr:hypothetical protein EJB05_56214 [Eragrostis curvula]
MATRALAAAVAGRRVAVQSGVPALASCGRGGGGGAQSDSSRRSAHTQAAAEEHDAVTAEQVKAAQNSKNIDGVVLQDQGGSRAATMRLPDEVVDDADAAWVPDQDTGVFVPAEEASNGATHDAPAPAATESVLDQTVFVREDEMEDVERPAVDMDNGDGAN